MVQFKIPQLGFFLRTEANVKFFIAFILLLVALYWANRTHRQRNLQIKQEEREDKIIIVVSTIVFLIVTVIVYRAFNQFSESLNAQTLREALRNKEMGLLGESELGARNRTGEGWAPERLTFTERLKRWLGGDGIKKKDFKTLILEAAIYGVLTIIVILLILICYPVTCRECNKEELKEQEAHNHPVPSSPSMPTTTATPTATPTPTQGMVVSSPRSMPEMTASATVPSPRLTPLSSEQEEEVRKRASGETSRGDNRTPPEDLTRTNRTDNKR